MKNMIADESQMMACGKALFQSIGAEPVQPVIYLHGDLGAGKTTLVRGFVRAAGYSGKVKSPTFTLLEQYPFSNFEIIHFDLYRLTDPEELEWIGVRDYLRTDTLWFVEWPERGEGCLPPADLLIRIRIENHGRNLEVESCSHRGEQISDRFCRTVL